MVADGTTEWAQEELGGAVFGDARRTRRLVAMATTAAANPGGKVTAVFRNEADREATFRLLENDDVIVDGIAKASHMAAVRRARGQEFVVVPIDSNSLNTTDQTGEKGLGVIGTRSIGAQGLCVMTAIAIGTDGTRRLGFAGRNSRLGRKLQSGSKARSPGGGSRTRRRGIG